MPGSSAITVGHFDGVHRGHVELIKAARAAAGPGGTVTAISFEPDPLAVLRPQAAPKQLSKFEQRREWLTEAGADEVVALRPTPELLRQSPEAFLTRLVREYRPSVIVEGPDFRFGRDRAGSGATIERLQGSLGYRTVIIDDVETALSDQAAVRVSSSLIRWLISRGRVRDGALLLGRPYELRGEVVSGDGRGAGTLGVPTANLDHGDFLLPADGIYAGVAVRLSEPGNPGFPAAISVGVKPTFGEHPRVCEAHLIGFEGSPDDYGWTMALRFHDWLRDQIAFDRVELLIDQVHRDIERVRQASGAGSEAFGVRRSESGVGA
ncbi:MAG: bifunctional riboflavin kinase/FMN adenylyltransferase [Planctomycetota bacterium]|jgi:riboflavin kinase/FMN adenylyltransferase